MKKVFISYSSEDTAVVERVTKAFTEHSISYWIDEGNIKIGNNYAKVIADAIKDCEVFCVFLSPHSNISRSVKNEINFAVMNNKKIIPILLDNVELSPGIEYYIADYQWIDWRKGDALDTLINRIMNKDSIQTENEYDIFICYRRNAGGYLGKLLYDKLTQTGYTVFLDFELLRTGRPDVQLHNAIANCKDFILVLSPGVLDRCVKDSEDWMLIEISLAIKYGKNIIPIIMHGFEWPEKLPDSIRKLTMYKQIVSQIEFFDGMFNRLCDEFLISNKKSAIRNNLNEKNYIFVSYAHKDIAEVFPIIEELQRKEFCLWYDEGIDPGSEWDENIAQHVENCTIMICFISQAYIDSENCKDELNYARDLGKKRLLVYIEDVKLPGGMRMRMGRQQAVYYHKYVDKREFYSKLSKISEIEECRMEKENLSEKNVSNVSAANDRGHKPVTNLKKKINEGPTEQWEQYKLGYSYEFGTNGVQDYEKAVYWYRKAANQGNAWSQNRLGDCYREGNGVTQNLKMAAEWYIKAAEQGDHTAQYNLGLCYSRGDGVPANDTVALQWYLKAAEQGDSWAQYAVGFAYEFGKGVYVDFTQAVVWYRKSADQGNAWSQNRLGDCFFNGNGVIQNYKEAVKWYKMSAYQNDTTACLNLANCYRNGFGVAKDISTADYWTSRAK